MFTLRDFETKQTENQPKFFFFNHPPSPSLPPLSA